SPLATGPLTRGSEFYVDIGEGRYPFDTQQARALISTLGYVDANGDGFWDTVDGELSVTMIVPPWGEYRQIAELLQDQLGAAGVRLETVSVPDFPSLLAEVEEGAYHLVPFGSYGVDPAFLSSYYSSTGSRNFGGVNDTTLDALLGNAARDITPAARAELYRQIQANIMDAALIVPLRERVNLNGVSARVENLVYDAYGWYPLLYNASYAP
nr:ABC transporter substrate-binding protein [Anaerolineae bacterium]